MQMGPVGVGLREDDREERDGEETGLLHWIWLPVQAGTPSHLPLAWPRYLTVSLTAPFCLRIGSMMSLTGSSNSAKSPPTLSFDISGRKEVPVPQRPPGHAFEDQSSVDQSDPGKFAEAEPATYPSI